MAPASPWRRLLVPLARLGVVLGHAQAVVIERAEVEHGARVAVGGGLFVPFARLGVVLRHALAVLIEEAEVDHRVGVALVGGLLDHSRAWRSLAARPCRSHRESRGRSWRPRRLGGGLRTIRAPWRILRHARPFS